MMDRPQLRGELLITALQRLALQDPPELHDGPPQ
jgi:hypothetical protein